jgi:F-type H+-transporting ATPase subunit alpha
VFLETDLFNSGVRPAINVGISVSRVGGNAQIKAMKKVAGTLKLNLAQYREMAAFAQFGSDLDKTTQEQLANGERQTEILKQPQYQPLPAVEQVISIYAASPQPGRKSWVRDLPVSDVRRYESEMLAYMRANHAGLIGKIQASGQIGADEEKALIAALDQFALVFQPSAKAE